MIYPIVTYGDPVLKQKSSEILKDYINLKELISDMYETMHSSKGIGLAAVQIGIPIKLFVIESRIEEEPILFHKVFINPIIVKEHGDNVTFTESCLSIPKFYGYVERKSNIDIEYYNENWELQKETYSGFKARIIQHEYDHLEGILYIERLKQTL